MKGRCCRGDAALANPAVHEFLEAEGVVIMILLLANQIFQLPKNFLNNLRWLSAVDHMWHSWPKRGADDLLWFDVVTTGRS